METIMQLTELMIRPKQDEWESLLAYLFRMAELNKTKFVELVASVLERLRDETYQALGLHTKVVPRSTELNRFAACMKSGRMTPLRWVCPKCVHEFAADQFFPDQNSLHEYCFLHGITPVDRCPKCNQTAMYGVGTYSRCECGHSWADTATKETRAEVWCFYRQIGANVPTGIDPTNEVMRQFSVTEINKRLLQVWTLLWTDADGINQKENWGYRKEIPAFGHRWESLVETLGVDQYKLNLWAIHMACWFRSLDQLEGVKRSFEEISWTYLRKLIAGNYTNGCSGPRMYECVLVGGLCKANKKGVRGDLLPRRSGTFFHPNFREPLIVRADGLRDGRPDPLGNERANSIEVLVKGNPLKREVLIQLVAIGAIQPIALTHPTRWEFPEGVLNQLFTRIAKHQSCKLSRLSIKDFNMNLLEFCEEYNMGQLFYGLFVSKDVFLLKQTDNFWEMRVMALINLRGNNLWHLEVIHKAVIGSLSKPARQASVIAYQHLTKVSDSEIQLYGGGEARQYALDTDKCGFGHLVEDIRKDEIQLVWHHGLLVG
jgi:hypothetical protein